MKFYRHKNYEIRPSSALFDDGKFYDSKCSITIHNDSQRYTDDILFSSGKKFKTKEEADKDIIQEAVNHIENVLIPQSNKK